MRHERMIGAAGSFTFSMIALARSARWRLLAVLAAFFLISPIGQPRADTLGLRYEIYGSGFHLLSFDVTIAQGEEAYRINSAFRTRGLLDSVVGFLLRAEATGRVDAGRLKPTEYASFSKMRGKMRNTRIEYVEDGTVTAEVTPPDKEKRTKVTPEQMVGTVDALTSTLIVGRALEQGGDCRQVIPVFDGRRRYDLQYEDRGIQELKKSSYSAFAGPARACRVKQHRISGFSTDPHDGEKTDEAAIWIASVLPGAPPMPVRIELESSWGYVYVHLAEVTGSAGTRKLAKE
jgi:hypothetical protein